MIIFSITHKHRRVCKYFPVSYMYSVLRIYSETVRRQSLPVPSKGESAPTFSTSAGFDILMSATHRHTHQHIWLLCSYLAEYETFIGQNQKEGVRSQMSQSEPEHTHCKLIVAESFTKPNQPTFIHSFQSVVRMQAWADRGFLNLTRGCFRGSTAAPTTPHVVCRSSQDQRRFLLPLLGQSRVATLPSAQRQHV